jgi:hypothetical protein
MKRILRQAAAVFGVVLTTGLSVGLGEESALAGQFGQQEVDQNRFVAIAAPYQGGYAHQLIILEQVADPATTRSCWSNTSAGNVTTVTPLLLNFDFRDLQRNKSPVILEFST